VASTSHHTQATGARWMALLSRSPCLSRLTCPSVWPKFLVAKKIHFFSLHNFFPDSTVSIVSTVMPSHFLVVIKKLIAVKIHISNFKLS
jgi:hypothetical protein